MTKQKLKLIFMGLLLGGFRPHTANAREKSFVIREAVGSSGTIFFGTIKAVNPSYLDVEVGRAIKGSASGQVRVRWDEQPSLERKKSDLKSGDFAIIFGAMNSGELQPYLGSRGVRPIQKSEESLYQNTVADLINYDSAASSTTKVGALSRLLSGGVEAQSAALEILYLDNPVPASALMPKIISLARGPNGRIAVPATQALRRVGTKEEIPVLIDLIGSDNKTVAETALMSVRRMTGKELPVDLNKEPRQRAKDIDEWRKWWGGNKDKTKLIR